MFGFCGFAGCNNDEYSGMRYYNSISTVNDEKYSRLGYMEIAAGRYRKWTSCGVFSGRGYTRVQYCRVNTIVLINEPLLTHDVISQMMKMRFRVGKMSSEAKFNVPFIIIEQELHLEIKCDYCFHKSVISNSIDSIEVFFVFVFLFFYFCFLLKF